MGNPPGMKLLNSVPRKMNFRSGTPDPMPLIINIKFAATGAFGGKMARQVVKELTSTRWRWIILLISMAMVLDRAAGNRGKDSDKAPPPTSSIALSLSDTFRVTGKLALWGADLAMETAGYGG